MGASDDTPAAELTIDQLARRAQMTVRNVRAHQSRGLLGPPRLRGRTGYYGPEHVARLELVKELQADGFSLELIRRLLNNAAGSSSEVLRFTHALRQPFGEQEEPEPVDPLDLARQWGTAEPELLLRAQRLGLLRQLPDGTLETPSPLLMRAGAELAALGLNATQALRILERMRSHADSVAKEFAELFLEQVWAPFDAAGRPPERWPEISETLERVRPLATQSMLAVFGLAMSEAVERAFGRELHRIEGSLREDEAA